MSFRMFRALFICVLQYRSVFMCVLRHDCMCTTIFQFLFVSLYVSVVGLFSYVYCVGIFSPAHRISESVRKLVVRAILGVWPQFWC